MDIEDTIALNHLAHRYAAAVDACDTDLFKSVFVPEARLRVYHPDANEPWTDMTGHERLASVPTTMRGMYRHTMHNMTNHCIDIDGARATGTVLCTARHLELSGETALVVMIRYVDQYAKHGGEWKIADREIRFLWSERHVVTDSGYGRRD